MRRHTIQTMDNNILLNIARGATDSDTAINIIKAVGSKEAFEVAKTFNIVRTIRYDAIKNSMCDVVFVVKNMGNEDNIIERIKCAFVDINEVIRIPKTFSMAAKGMGNMYMIIHPYTITHLMGMVFLKQLELDGDITIMDDVRVSMPVDMADLSSGAIYVLCLTNSIRFRVTRVVHRSFLIDFDHVVRRISDYGYLSD